jgi:26S proteasome regulatory subunit N5
MENTVTTTEQSKKMEVDYSATVDEKIPKCEKLAKQGKLNEALDMLLSLEKQTRTASDTHSTSRILSAIVRLCFETKNWDALNENIVIITKKRGQIKQVNIYRLLHGIFHIIPFISPRS